jgi:hypothetical protein
MGHRGICGWRGLEDRPCSRCETSARLCGLLGILGCSSVRYLIFDGANCPTVALHESAPEIPPHYFWEVASANSLLNTHCGQGARHAESPVMAPHKRVAPSSRGVTLHLTCREAPGSLGTTCQYWETRSSTKTSRFSPQLFSRSLLLLPPVCLVYAEFFNSPLTQTDIDIPIAHHGRGRVGRVWSADWRLLW